MIRTSLNFVEVNVNKQKKKKKKKEKRKKKKRKKEKEKIEFPVNILNPFYVCAVLIWLFLQTFLLESRWCNYTVALTRLQLEKFSSNQTHHKSE